MRLRFTRALLLIVVAMALLSTRVLAQDRFEFKTVPQSATQLAVDLYRQMRDEEKNLFVSPYSIYTVLALMYGGAAGETAEQMAAALHVSLEAEAFQAALAGVQDILNQIRDNGEVELDIANSLWPQAGASLDPQFLHLAERYGAEIFPVDYRTEPEAVRSQINAWAEDKTNGRIKNVVNWDLHPETHLLLANAIFFKGNWARQFDKAKTSMMPFHRLDNDPINVPMMMQLGRFPIAWTESAQILQLPYEGGDLSMIIVLPREPHTILSLEEQTTLKDIESWREDLSEEYVYVYLPRFEITSTFDLIKDGVLRALGIIRALNQSEAEFPGIGTPENWFSIQRFVHKAFVEVNEQGTEAAAATVGGCFPAGTPVLTPNGPVLIEAVEPGTVVYSFDLSKGRWISTRVAQLRAYPFSGDMVTLRLASDAIKATWNHPFFVTKGEGLENRPVPMDLPVGEEVSSTLGRWVEARDIRLGDVLLNRSGDGIVVSGTSSRNETVEVYDLEIAEIHNHMVGQQGILVHNGKQKQSVELPSFRADHPFLFFIHDVPTGSILFMGRVVDPSGE